MQEALNKLEKQIDDLLAEKQKLEASLKQAQERIEELEKENRELSCNHSFDDIGVCELCGLGETEEIKAEQEKYNKAQEQLQKAKADVIGKIRDWARNEPIGYRQYSTIDLLEFLKLIEEEE